MWWNKNVLYRWSIVIECLEQWSILSVMEWENYSKNPHKTTKQLSSTNLIFFQICIHTKIYVDIELSHLLDLSSSNSLSQTISHMKIASIILPYFEIR